MSGLSDTLKSMGPARLGMMGAVLVGIVVFFIFITARMSSSDMALLYGNLASSDTGAVAAKLEQMKIPYEVSADGSSVLVASSDVGRARMVLAEEGLPGSGSVGYEIFDKQSSLGTTDFVQNVNQVRALEGELGKTISTLAPVKTARIHLVLPKRQLFSRETQNATASVFVKLRPGESLNPEQIAAIQHMVAAAVPQLKPTRVSIVDESGKLLARGVDAADDPEGFFQNSTEEKKSGYEARLSRMIETMVGEIVGFGKVRANVSAELNFDRITSNAEIYDPEGQVVRSTQVIEENLEENDEATNQGVTVANNLPGLAGAPGTENLVGTKSNRVEEVTNFEITKRVENHVRESGQVDRLSVAVLLDGTYTTNAEGERVYTPRSQEELEQIENLVRSAIGFDDARGDSIQVVNMQFAGGDIVEDMLPDNTIMGFERADLLDIAETVTLAIVALLVVLLVLQPLVNKLIESASNVAAGGLDNELENLITSQLEQQRALAAPQQEEELSEAMISLDKVSGRVKASSVQKVNELVDKHPAETVSVIRNWMYQE